MKNLLTIIFYSVFIIAVNAQENWPPVGASWYYNYNPCDILDCPDVEEFIYFEATKDTSINDTVCTKIKAVYHKTDGNTRYLGSEYLYSTANKVYLYHHDHFNLLYDFSKEIGEYLSISFGLNTNLYDKLEPSDINYMTEIVRHKITDKDSIEIDGKKHLYIELDVELDNNETLGYYNHFGNRKIIKGVGSLTFLTGNLWSPIEAGNYGPLRCYFDSNLIYKTEIPCDTVITAINKTSGRADIKIYPLPSDSKKLYFDFGSQYFEYLEIYNLKGVLLAHVPIKNRNTYVYAVDHIPSGLYFYAIYSNNGRAETGKFIVE